VDNSHKIILDLCGGTGGWSRPYERAGYKVIIVDPSIENGMFGDNSIYGNFDVRLLQKPHYEVHGILCAPPCTVFASSGARWKRSDADMVNGLSVVDACLRIVWACKPKWWALENPVGKLVRYLGKPKLYFQPCDYGDPYTKKTCLWGEFNEPKKTPVVPTLGSRIHTQYGGKSANTKRARSKTPVGFANAFFEANP
jgi:hypothetical protein